MPDTLTYIITGTVLGLTAGISPGPLLTLVISETLKRGCKAGVGIALVPLLSDIPIVLASIFILSKIANFHLLLGVLTCIGAVFVAYLGFESFTVRGLNPNIGGNHLTSFGKGVMINILSPYPYLFWGSVGGPLVLKAIGVNPMHGVTFLFTFYLFLVSSKVIVALVVGRSKLLATEKAFKITIRTLGGILFGFAIYLLYEGLQLIGFF